MASRAANCVRLKRCSPKVACAEQAQRENDRRKERGILAGRSKKNCGPHLTAVLLTDGSQVCIVYRLSTRVVPCAALAFPSLRRFLTVAPACWPQGKILPHPSARSALHSSPQDGGPKGFCLITASCPKTPLLAQKPRLLPKNSGLTGEVS